MELEWEMPMLQVLALLGLGVLSTAVPTVNQDGLVPDTILVFSEKVGSNVEDMQELIAGKWQVRDLSTGPIPVGQEIIMEFSESDVTVQSTCNRLTASVDFSGSGILFGPVTSSRVDCTAERAETERRFLYEVGRAGNLKVSADGELKIYAFGLLLIRAER